MRFAHISDLHLCEGPGANLDVRKNAREMAEILRQDLERISESLDFIVLSGDITEDAHPDSFKLFEALFAPLSPPLYTIPGNHDGPAAYVARAGSGSLANYDITGKVADLGAVRLVGFNTCIEGETAGAITESDLQRLSQELTAEGTATPIIVMHHPPFETGLQEFDEIGRLEGASAVAELVRQAARVPIILCGHVHRPYVARWSGAACFIAGSPALPFTSELPFGETPIRPSNEEPCYFVHSLDSDGSHVVTPQQLRQMPGEP